MIGNVELEQIASTIEQKLKKVFDSIIYFWINEKPVIFVLYLQFGQITDTLNQKLDDSKG
jgi:hypothetical protein